MTNYEKLQNAYYEAMKKGNTDKALYIKSLMYALPIWAA